MTAIKSRLLKAIARADSWFFIRKIASDVTRNTTEEAKKLVREFIVEAEIDSSVAANFENCT